ncbi:hypothetical protein [Actinokineospora bangkokensis]|uniref:Uncharacterized protein n=1 Tax=Actinokineospora bangkokensis TaxID=1193682 RepID=A0A1Q9LI65_9PSEU|nr:hypothetical protein [Actinokineospora bangkokensis]OLR91713.1 hypothetical protein BJP25_25225 [Actinokineospora bangkokensis]
MSWFDRFYRVPHDLRPLEAEIGRLAELMDAELVGATPVDAVPLDAVAEAVRPGLVRPARDEVTRQSIQVRARLARQDRLGELDRFRRRVLRTAAASMDEGVYRKVFVPYVETILPKRPG